MDPRFDVTFSGRPDRVAGIGSIRARMRYRFITGRSVWREKNNRRRYSDTE